MGQGPGQPTDRDPLEPPADQRDAVAADVNEVVAMRKDAGDVAQAARCLSTDTPAQPFNGQQSSHPEAFPTRWYHNLPSPCIIDKSIFLFLFRGDAARPRRAAVNKWARTTPAFEPQCSRALSRCSPSALRPSPRSSLCANRSRWRTIGQTSRRTAMPVIDVQVHPFDRNHPGRPWASPSHGLASATGEEMVAEMKSVGVDGAIMVSSFSAYEYDPSYALEVYNTYPDKFRVVTPVDATNPAIDDVVAKWAATEGARGIRIRMRDGLPMDADHPGLHRAFAAAGQHELPVNLLCWGILDKGLPHIQRHRRYGHRYRPSRPAATCSPAGPRRGLGRSSQAARPGSIRERKGEDQRCLHDVAPTVPIRR